MPDLEIIAVDPDCFYASTEDDSDVDIEGVQNVSDESIPLKSISSHHIHVDNDSMDIITLNIDDSLLIDSPEEDILFLADGDNLQPFDLASYIVGESSSSFLLSPPPALLKQRTPLKLSSARQRLISMSDFTNAIPKNVNESSTKQAAVPVQKSPVPSVQKILAPSVQRIPKNPMQKMPANNRRKRKILTREFIYTSSSSDDDDEHQKSNKSSIGGKAMNYFANENSNSKKRNDNDIDPIWTPSTGADTKSKCKKLTKQTSVISPIDVKLNNTVDSKKSGKNMTQTQCGGGLRQLMKHQIMSSRPIKSKILKTNPPAPNVDKTKIQKPSAKMTGLGRGKDISITAKYNNCSESSDNCDRDKNHTVRNLIETSSESDSSVSTDLPQKDDVRVERTCVAANSNKLMQSEHKLTATETKSNAPALIDSSSMDSRVFTKALKINAESVDIKSKPLKRRIDVDHQKRIIKSTIPLPNPLKFKKTPTGESKPFRDLKTANNSNLIPPKNVMKVLEKTQNVQTADIKPENIAKLGKNEIVMENRVKPQVVVDKEIKKEATDEIKVESTAKRKLNIEEYLKRKSLKRLNSSGFEISQNNSKIIQKNTSDYMKNSDKIEIDKTNQKIPFENSIYEEIIIVSMGCNTDISIPAASFVKKSDIQNSKSINPTVLLSNIQTTVEKVNSTADTAIISSTSLISSIQNVILKKTCGKMLCGNDQNKLKLENKETKDDKDDEQPEHGENKVIMHLPKDRIRPTTVTISIQTEPYFQFPPLEKFSSLAKKQMMTAGKRIGSIPKDDAANRVHINNNKGTNHKNRRNRSKTALSESSYYSDENQSSSERRSRYSDFYDSNGEERVRSHSRRKFDRFDRHRTISRSLSESSDASNSSTDSSSSSDSSSSGSSVSSAISSSKSFNSYGGSSSRSYYGDDNQFYRIRTKSNNSRKNRSRPHRRSNSPGTLSITTIHLKSFYFIDL